MENGKSMVLASFLADSLALGAHWIYDTEKITRTFGRVESLLKPQPDSFHATKDKGEFTHYGDQTLVLLQSVAARKEFDLQDFSDRWRALFADYQGYMDQATKKTLAGYESGKTIQEAGSPSNDLAGASRIAPVVFCYRNNLDKLITAAGEQTKMTHTDPHTVESAEFFGRVAWSVLEGSSPAGAMKKVAEENFSQSPLRKWVQSGMESKDSDTTATISSFGQSCHTPEAFPGVVHIITKYENDLREGLIESVMAGGDSAARGMLVGMVLGAHLGPKALPEKWLSELRKRELIEDLLKKI